MENIIFLTKGAAYMIFKNGTARLLGLNVRVRTLRHIPMSFKAHFMCVVLKPRTLGS